MNQDHHAPENDHPAELPGEDGGYRFRQRRASRRGVHRVRIDQWRDGDNGQFVSESDAQAQGLNDDSTA
jgi:hypothetical protein